MQTQVRNGMIKTMLEQSGKFSHYECTLPIPKEVVHLVEVENRLRVKNTNYYKVVSKDWDEIWKKVTAMQVIVNTHKRAELELRHEVLLNRLSNFQ